MDYFLLILLAIVLILATAFDLHQRRIPNALTLPVMAVRHDLLVISQWSGRIHA